MKKTLSDVASWGYQLQNINPAALVKSGCDLLVIDPKTGDDLIISPQQVADLRSSGKLVVAYLSIGEAEDYRPYWQSGWYHHRPVWLGAENPEWKGNYTVKFWYREWRDIILGVLKQYKALGFDGVYLDKVDIVDEFEHDPAVRGEMRALIAELRDAAGPDFIIIQQNAPEMLELTRDLVDGVAVEDLFYGEDGDGVENSKEAIADKVRMLRAFGKPVFVVEYDAPSVNKAVVSIVARSKGWVPLIAHRALNRLPDPDNPVGKAWS